MSDDVGRRDLSRCRALPPSTRQYWETNNNVRDVWLTQASPASMTLVLCSDAEHKPTRRRLLNQQEFR
ncbi:MAG: hypothetical protein MI750_13000 [Xanthomonadales bacterium]|nr:hypothetical protein [Xanthomonadales bacterium]